MNEIEVLLRDGTLFKVHSSKLTTHEHSGVQPCNESLRKVFHDRNHHIAIVEKSGYPDSNIEKRIFSDEILDIRKDGVSVMKKPEPIPDAYRW